MVIDARVLNKPQHNDDRFLNYCYRLENPIFLTGDKLLHLKSQSINIKSIQVSNMKSNVLETRILKELGISDFGAPKTENEENLEKLKRIAEITIQPTITAIIRSELG